MEFAKDSVLKMNWDKRGYYKKDKAFYLASQEYTNTEGKTVPVYFGLQGAYFWADDNAATYESLWQVDELMPFLKKNADGSFPTGWGEYVSIMDSNGVLDDKWLEKFGILSHKADIEARIDDVMSYAEESDGVM